MYGSLLIALPERSELYARILFAALGVLDLIEYGASNPLDEHITPTCRCYPLDDFSF